MTKKIRILIMIVIIAVIIILIAVGISYSSDTSAAVSDSSHDQAVTTEQPASSQAASSTASSEASAAPAPSAVFDPIEYRDNQISYEYYDVASDTNKSTAVPIEQEGTLASPLEILAEQFFHESLASSPLNPNSVTLTGGAVYIDFTSGIYSAGLGSSSEISLLNSIYNAYTQNIQGVEKLYISVDGEDYSSGHVEFAKDQPYAII